MAKITMDREAYEALKSDARALDADSKVASFLAGKFEAGEAEARQRSGTGDEPTWIFNIWTWTFDWPKGSGAN